jgi:hypothetical protein
MPTGREELAQALLLHVAAGTLDAQEAAPAVRALVGGASPSTATRLSLLQALRAQPPDGLGPAIDALVRRRFGDVEAAHALKAAGQPLTPELAAELADLPLDVPLGWRTGGPGGTRWAEAYELLQQRLFLAGAEAPPRLREEESPPPSAGPPPAWPRRPRPPFWSEPRRLLAAAARSGHGRCGGRVRARGALRGAGPRGRAPPWPARTRCWPPCPAPIPEDVPEEALLSRLPASFRRADAAHQRVLLDVALAWPTAALVPALLAIATEPWAQERAFLVLTLRFGPVHGPDWRAWSAWLRAQEWRWRAPGPSPPPNRRRSSGLLVWELQDGGGGREVVGFLEAWARRRPSPVRAHAIVERWRSLLSTAEANALLGTSTPTGASALPPPLPPPIPEAARSGASPPPARPSVSAPARPRPQPPAWQRHVQGFFAENWYMVAGVLMVVVGSSLLAYFTWDRNWLLRYTIVPVLLAGFTATLAVTASWLEKTDRHLAGTGATLRGAADRAAARQLHGGGAPRPRPAGHAQARRRPRDDLAATSCCSGPPSCAGRAPCTRARLPRPHPPRARCARPSRAAHPRASARSSGRAARAASPPGSTAASCSRRERSCASREA